MVKFLGILLAIVLSLSLGAETAFAQTWSGQCVEGDVATIAGVVCLIRNLLRFIPPLVIIAAVFMIIFAGSRLILGGEDPKQYQQGMETLLYAVIGILGLGFVWFILVAIQQFTGAPVTEIRFGQ